MKMIIAIATLLTACYAVADVAPLNELNNSTINVMRVEIGSGTPSNALSNVQSFDSARPVTNDMWHVPGYMPGYPTAATLWPRVITVACDKALNGQVYCGGYNIIDAQIGRGEYVYIKPVIRASAIATPASSSVLPQLIQKIPEPLMSTPPHKKKVKKIHQYFCPVPLVKKQ